MKMRPKKNKSNPALEKTEFESLQHPAQLQYVKLRRQADRVRPDQVLIELLAFGILWSEIELVSAGELKILRKLIDSQESNITSINLVSKLRTKRIFERKLASLGLTKPIYWDKHEVLKLTSSLAKGLSLSICLTNLQLNGIRLTIDSSKALSTGISQSRSLRYLSISHSHCGDHVFKWIAKGVCENTTIREVDFSFCKLTEEAGGDICDVIRSHAERRNDARWTQSLRDMKPGVQNVNSNVALQGIITLDLSNNMLGNIFASSLARVLANDIWVGAINLEKNKIKERGVLLLYETVKTSNNTIAIINVKQNKFQDIHPENMLNDLLLTRGPHTQHGMFSLPYEAKKENPASIIATAISSWGTTHQVSDPTAAVVSALVDAAPKRLTVPALLDLTNVLRSTTSKAQPGVRIRKQNKQSINNGLKSRIKEFGSTSSFNKDNLMSLQTIDKIDTDTLNDEENFDCVENSLIALNECIEKMGSKDSPVSSSEILGDQTDIDFNSESQQVLERLQVLWKNNPTDY